MVRASLAPPSTSKKRASKKSPQKPESHPVFDEWRAAREIAGLSEPTPGKGNLAQAKKLAELIPDAERRQKVMAEFFALEDPKAWLQKGGYQLWQLVNHRLDACLANVDGNPAPKHAQKRKLTADELYGAENIVEPSEQDIADMIAFHESGDPKYARRID